jgi:hypothetical protein
MLLLTGLRVDSSYVAGILPAEVLLGLGMGCVFVPAFNLATQGVNPREAGIASATANTAQQVGGSIGTALLNTVAASAATGAAATHAAALVHGYAVATGWGAAILAVAALLAAALVNAGTPIAHSRAGAASRGDARSTA